MANENITPSEARTAINAIDYRATDTEVESVVGAHPGYGGNASVARSYSEHWSEVANEIAAGKAPAARKEIERLLPHLSRFGANQARVMLAEIEQLDRFTTRGGLQFEIFTCGSAKKEWEASPVHGQANYQRALKLRYTLDLKVHAKREWLVGDLQLAEDGLKAA